jgi:GrpB-like predicted nucleotidyltransferase (UPF0157 family)
MPSRYRFAEYSSEWPREIEREAKRWRELLGAELIEVHHIGSTSVPGLAAKLIIDVLPLVREIGRVDEVSAALEDAGCKAWGEYGIPGRRFFTRDSDGERTHNVHLFEKGNPERERHLAFCAYLRSHPEACDE